MIHSVSDDVTNKRASAATRSRRGLASLLAIAAMTGAPLLGVLAQQATSGDSPASGTAAVVAQGVASLPSGNAVWRVVQGSGDPADSASQGGASLGFLVADQGTLLVQDVDTGSQDRLPAGEAAFVGGSGKQIRASLGSDPAAYYALELVGPDAGKPDGGQVTFTGEAFAAPAKRHDLDLVRDPLAAGETATLPAGDGPSVVLVTEGAATVTTSNGASATLGTGQSGSFSGDLTLTGGSEGAVVLAGRIGPEVPQLGAGATDKQAKDKSAQNGQTGQAAASADANAGQDKAKDKKNKNNDQTDQAGQAGAAAEATVAPQEPAPDTQTQAEPTPPQEAVVVATEAPAEEAPTEAPPAEEPTVAPEAVATEETSGPDIDGDGLTDAEEQAMNTDPAKADTDGDGLTDGQEVKIGTQPLVYDTDGDGVGDGDEIAQGTDPLTPGNGAGDAGSTGAGDVTASGDATATQDPYSVDTDGDGLLDGQEVDTRGTDPNNPDTDGDGYSDGEEVMIHGTDPLDPASHP